MTILVQEGFKQQGHLVKEVIKDRGHCEHCHLPQPTDPDGPTQRSLFLNTIEQQPGTHQEVLVRNFVQSPIPRRIRNPSAEVEERTTGKSIVERG
jgi:hypothetical protein